MTFNNDECRKYPKRVDFQRPKKTGTRSHDCFLSEWFRHINLSPFN